MEHTIDKQLHLEKENFRDLIHATSEELAIPIQLVEKDYYISSILRALYESSYTEQIVFKGGTSLSKAYQLINRFSEDVDFAVISENMSGNQVKMLLSHLMKEVTANLKEDRCFGDISKGSKYRKQAFLYETQVGLDELSNPVPARIIVEISAFANPFPHERRIIEPFVTTFLRKKGMSNFIEQYNLAPFELNVLSLRQTLCEKVVSLIRFSMSDTPLASLTSKVRHFYDLDALLSIEQLQNYISSDAFVSDLTTLIRHDQQAFDEPQGWRLLYNLNQSPLIKNFENIWSSLTPKYIENLSKITYRTIPSPDNIKSSFTKILHSIENIDLGRQEN